MATPVVPNQFAVGKNKIVHKPTMRSGGKTGGSGRDNAPWAVFHIQFDKHPIEPLRLRHVSLL